MKKYNPTVAGDMIHQTALLSNQKSKGDGVTASKFIHIRSVDKDSGNSSTSFNIDLKRAIEPDFSDQKMFLSLVSAVIPNTFHQINSNNDTFYISLNDGTTYHDDIPVVLPHCSPSVVDFIYLLIQSLDNTLAAFSIGGSFNATDFSYIGTTNDAELINTNRIIIAYTAGTGNDFTFTSLRFVNKQSASLFSMDVGEYLALTNNIDQNYIISKFINLASTNNLQLRIRNINTPHVYESRTESNSFILANILIDTGFGTLFYYYPSYRNSIESSYNFINTLNFELTDSYGNVVDLNGLDWEFVLRVDFRMTRNE